MSTVKARIDPDVVRRDTVKTTAQLQFVTSQLLATLTELTENVEEMKEQSDK